MTATEIESAHDSSKWNLDNDDKPILFADSCSLIDIVQRRAELQDASNRVIAEYCREIQAVIWFRDEIEAGRIAVLITKEVKRECRRLLSAKIEDVRSRVRADINCLQPHILMGRVFPGLRQSSSHVLRRLEGELEDERAKIRRMKENADDEVSFLADVAHRIIAQANVIPYLDPASKIERRVDERLSRGLAPAHHGSKNASSDCYIIETVFDVAEGLSHSKVRVFLSSNSSDFGAVGGRRVHDDLREDFERVGLQYAHLWQHAKSIIAAAHGR